uniref:Protein crumbs homolog 1-like n=1 Tax=Cynoglossus semilaevis TaxID=244447 RepID=A0A3P8WML0_CYNSE
MDDYACLCPKKPVWYMGKRCDELYDACISAPCENCTSKLGTHEYTCHCPAGFTGLNCTEDIDECLSNPCNGTKSHCLNGINTYSCHCPLGFKGLYCEENIDDCESGPCQNGAICRDGINTYQCFCVPGFQGYHCDLDINECASHPCQNNGTCLDEVDYYTCYCAQGFKGFNCEEEIDECEEHPCRNGATCLDYIAMFSCECAAGFQGYICEVNIDECVSMPCLNAGKCIDGVNSYECDCTETGFFGDHCEIDIPECASNPCKHGSTCMEGINQYTCICWPGYEGENCEVDINECEQHPCENGGNCFQRSDTRNYGLVPELSTFTYENAAGFICHCQPGFTGDNCSVNIDECEYAPCQHGAYCQDMVNSYQCVCPDGFTGPHCELDIDECESNPCQNNATCEDTTNSYRCHCLTPETGQEPWGGRDCDIRLIGCHQHMCQNMAACAPILTVGGDHSYTCLCPPGWTGAHCNTSTTFSFNSEGYVSMQLPGFKNASTEQSGDYVHKHHMQFRFRTTLPDMVLYYQGTAEHHLVLELVGGSVQAVVKSMKVTKVTCPGPLNDGEWHQVTVTMDDSLFLTVNKHNYEERCQVKNEVPKHRAFLQSSTFQQLYVGGAPQDYLHNTSRRKGFIGCMEDLHVDQKLFIPHNHIREENKGLELGCSKQDWCQDDPCMQQGQCVDMWVRASCLCRRPYYGKRCEKEYPSWTFGHENTSSFSTFSISESHGDNFTVTFFLRSLKLHGLLLQLTREGKPYLTIYLKEGIIALYSSYTTVLSETKFVTDGNNNLVTVKVQSGPVFFDKTGNHHAFRSNRVEAGDVAYVGGLPAGKTMKTWGGHFKGCLQDIRLDDKHLSMEDHQERIKVYKATRMEYVMMGCQSDDTCKGEPCFNSGHCEVTWNDFRCHCSINFSGQLCETRLWCVDSPCADGTRCVDLHDGYECLTEASFNDNSLQYTSTNSTVSPVTNITLNIRTRDHNGILLRATSRAEIFCLGLLNSSLLVKLNTGENATVVVFTSDWTIADGSWHHIQLTMVDSTQAASGWYLDVDGKRAGSSVGVAGTLSFPTDTHIWLAEKYSGCLGEIRVGGVYLPLIHVPHTPQMKHFARLGGREPIIGCQGTPVCDSQPCQNSGVCQDHFFEFNCSCTSGWTGGLCEMEVNECASSPCAYGTCEDLLADYQCHCLPGYTGKNCQEELDNCLEYKCMNGGACIKTADADTCSCPPGYIGKRCQWRSSPVECDAETECLNEGVCIESNMEGNCICKSGFTGFRCETEIDECGSNPCLNNATCLDKLDNFQCMCVPGFTGLTCEAKKEQSTERVPWLAVTIPLTTLCMLLTLLVVFFLFTTARKKRQSEGTYSPSSQEVAGARLEMGSVLKVPPEERLI